MHGSNPPFPETPHMQATDEAAITTTSEYEKTDVSVKAVAWSAFFMAIGILVTLAGAWEVLKYFRSTIRTEDSFASSLKQTEDYPTKPRLQTTALRDFEQFTQSQDSILNHYSVGDLEQATVRIPISRAIELIAERGNSATAPLPKPELKANPEVKSKIGVKDKLETKSK